MEMPTQKDALKHYQVKINKTNKNPRTLQSGLKMLPSDSLLWSWSLFYDSISFLNFLEYFKEHFLIIKARNWG